MSDSDTHIVVLNWKKSNVLAELGIDAERRSIYRDISRTTKSPPHSKTRSKMCLTVKQVSRKSPPLQNGETGLGASTVELI